MTQPYYHDEAAGITVYHGDCREVLPCVAMADLLLTDPPYGIRADEAASKNNGRWGWKNYGQTAWDRERPSRETFDLMRARSCTQIVWGGNYFTDRLPPSQCWLVWDKGQREFSLADFEMAWTGFDNASRIVEVPRGRALLDGKQHPTQKSVDVMRWCVTAVADRYAKAPPHDDR